MLSAAVGELKMHIIGLTFGGVIDVILYGNKLVSGVLICCTGERQHSDNPNTAMSGCDQMFPAS